MIPILFAENSTVFTSNGIGRLSDAISCVVNEERNGQFELQMVYPESGVHFSDIGIRKIIVAKPSASGSLQPFRIYKITKPINSKVTISAQHISYDLTKNVAMPFEVTASGSACGTVLQRLKSNAVESCPFTFWTDVTTVASYTQKAPASIRSRLGGSEGSVLDQFGGEYEWDNFNVRLHRDRGVVTGVTLRYGKNITDLEQDENIANTVTGVVPFWMNVDKTKSTMLPERVVYAPNASAYSSHLTVPLDLSSEWQEQPTEEALRTKARVYVNRAGFGLPKVSIKVSFVNLADTEEYKDLIPLQNVNLCDTVNVQFEKLGINTTAKIVETEYDVLKEKYISVQIGSLKSTLALTINDMNQSMISSITDTGERVYAEVNTDVSDMVDNATAWLTSGNGYVVAVKNDDGSWKELLFMDDDDMDQARNVIRINENGLGFSSTGVGGPYTQAWTLDGRLIIGGTNVPSLTCYDSGGHIIFQAARDGVIWNATNSSMSKNGTLTASNVQLNGEFYSDGIYSDIRIKDGEIQGLDNYGTEKCSIGMNSQGLLHLSADDGTLIGGHDLTVFADDHITLETDDGDGASLYLRNDIFDIYADRIRIHDAGSSGSYTGYDGDVVTNVDTDEITVLADVTDYDNYYVTFEHVTGVGMHGVKHGIVVE